MTTPESTRSAARAVTDGNTILATIDVATTPEQVFRALNTAEVVTWWGSDDIYRATEWASDLRVGGQMSWAVFLLSLKEFVETGKGRPFPDDMPR